MYQLFDFKNRDNQIVGYHFPCENPTHVLCLIHGIAEHVGRYRQVAEWFNEANIAVVAMDLRGHGRSKGIPGDCAPGKEVLKDVDSLILYAKEFYPDVPIVIYSHSMGGNIALDYRAIGNLNGVPVGYVIGSPWIRLTNPFKMLQHFTETKRSYKGDSLTHTAISPRCAVERFFIGRALEKGKYPDNGNAKNIPCLLMHGTSDKICDIRGSRNFAARQDERYFTYKEFTGYCHELHNGTPDGKSGKVVIDIVISYIKNLGGGDGTDTF